MTENVPMVSEVSISNQALTWVGADPIISFADQNTTAEWCRNNYPFLRDAVMESRMWTFATARAISTTQDRDEWDQMYSHALPQGWLAVFRCYRDVSNVERPLPSRQWRREGRRILALEDKVYLWGVRRITDTGQFSALFVQALAARMAADMAMPLAESRQLQIDHWKIYGEKLEDAAARDGQQGGGEFITQNQLTDVRFGGGYG